LLERACIISTVFITFESCFSEIFKGGFVLNA
jgi:hypothetical protein